ncbi:MAG: rhomboid family intramembrane serine protease [Phycicoccus sp.]|nr:rhomboid family intramembrane serine protease [Phycicoccus sp.]
MSEPTPYGPAGQAAAEPVCPRHPDRVSYVSCQRCRRPVCPQCQRPAAVGVQCVDCVAEGAKSVRQGRTVFGGALTDGRPRVTMAIIGICVAVFGAQQLIPSVTERLAFAPFIGVAEPWRFLTAAFVHGGFMHIAFNMYALWLMGQYLEPLLGRGRFIALYLISALGGSVGYLLLAAPLSGAQLAAGMWGAWMTPAVGASGAVFGLFGAFLVLNRSLGRSSAGIGVVIIANGVIGFVVPGIAWQAHLGGLVTGLACAAVLAFTGRKRDPLKPANAGGSWAIQWLGLAGIAVLLVALAVLKYAMSGGFLV